MDFISSLIVGFAQVLCESMNMADRRGHNTDLRQAITDLETAIGDLKAIRDDLSLRIQQDNLEGRSCSNRVSVWLSAVQATETKAASILVRCRRREQRTRMRRRCLGCFGCADYKLCNKVCATLKSIDELRERSEDIKTDGGSIQQTCTEIPIKSVVGNTTMMERVMDFLSEEEERGIIGVYGPGGVGKTTLMQSINNELITKGHQYDVLIWVQMSREFGECTIQQAVGARLGLSWDEKETGENRALKIYRALRQKQEHSIEIEQLVEYWVGEGFLTSSHGVNTIYKGHFLIGDLKAACLLETGDEKTQVKMHNVVRSFALWMASEQGTYKELILVEPNMGHTEAPKAENWRQALVISLIDNRIQTLPENPICPKLTTLMLQQNSSLKKIPTGFFMHMPILRVLDLSFTSITEIPLSIKNLVELYHLSMSGTKISVLPQELGNLRKLKHLDLQRTQFLQTIPRDAICWVSKLEVLNLYYSYAGWELQSFGEDDVEELGFDDLEYLENLTTLGITVLSSETLQTLYEFGALHKHIQHLHVEECNGLLYFNLPSLTNHGRNLRRLSIKSCHDLEYLVTSIDVENDWLPSLEVLTLHSLHKLSRVWGNPVSQECLRNIRCINISHCNKLKNVSWVPKLPKLEVIDLFDCRELEELISEHESPSVEDPTLFPSLKTLTTRDLPELKSILPSRFSFQKIETLVITNCPKVKKLPFQETNMPTVYCEEKWWNALEKDEPNKELCYLPRFVPN
ncbi:unnamed protein product [Arabidopsis arenosa]|uniref:RPS2 n=1 Tax=Arabidopsis arenosa TaxID=38785 RepID=A0A8S2APW9_ARAAE|nr:unnamed protein product [Arabidopsis arenosa]